MSIDDATLLAFADGELAPEEAARVEAEAARDPALRARIERVRALRSALAAAYDDTLTEPPPERLTSAISGGAPEAEAEVIDLAPVRRRRAPYGVAPLAIRWGSVAASLVVAFAFGRFFTASPKPPALVAGPSGGLVAQGTLAASLERQLASTQSAAAPVKIGVSFQGADGRYCRTFLTRQAHPLAGLACRNPAGWQVRMAVEAAPLASAAGGYATAAAETPAPVLEAVDQSIRGQPLDAAAEAKARDAGWGVKR